MAYHILEVQKVDNEGRVLLRQYFVVNEAGEVVINQPFATLAAALEALEELESEDEPPPPRESGGSRFEM